MIDATQLHSDYGWIDDVALASGLGVILFGLVVMGVFETIIGSAHFTEHVSSVGVIIVHTSFTPHLRAYTVALGFLVLLVWGLYRVTRSILASLTSDVCGRSMGR